MTIMKKLERKEILVGRLRHGDDLLEGITALCKGRDIRMGWISGLGAVRKARIASYDQEKREYEFLELDQPLEITNITGNISIKGAEPMAHVHVTLADDKGKAYGGHLAPGTIVFACELKIESLDGPVLERQYDQETGLALWPTDKE